MPTTQEIAEAVAILTGGRIAQVGAGVIQQTRAEARAFRALSRGGQARAAGATALRGSKFVARQAVTKNPWGVAALLAYEGYINRDEIADVAESLAAGEGFGVEGPTGIAKKRTISKANKAVKFAMDSLKAGTKATTGADKGKYPKGAWSLSTKAAGLANPNTTSKIKKGKSKLMTLARKIKKWWK